MPGAGGTQRLTRAIGKARAMEMILTGRTMSAAEAHALGLVTTVVPAEATVDAALELAARIATMPPLAIRAAKAAVRDADERGLRDGLARGAGGVLPIVRHRGPGRRDERLHREARPGLVGSLTMSDQEGDRMGRDADAGDVWRDLPGGVGRDSGDGAYAAIGGGRPDHLTPLDPSGRVSGHDPAAADHRPPPIADAPEHDWKHARDLIYPAFRPVGTQGLSVVSLDREALATLRPPEPRAAPAR